MYSSTVMHSLTNFVNLKIKSTQSFGCAHMDKIYVYIFRGEWLYVYEYLCLCDIKREYQMNRTTHDIDVKIAKRMTGMLKWRSSKPLKNKNLPGMTAVPQHQAELASIVPTWPSMLVFSHFEIVDKDSSLRFPPCLMIFFV
jgi:hypothetical protein